MATLNTPIYGFPYPDGAERVMDGDNAIGALANAIEGPLSTHASVLMSMQPTLVRSSAPVTLTQSDQITPGATATISPTQNEVALIWGSFHFKVTTAGAGGCWGGIYQDGVSRPGRAILNGGVVGEGTVMFMTTCALSPGNHTLDLRVRKEGTGGVVTCESAMQSTHMVIQRYRTVVALLRAIADGSLTDDMVEGAPV